MISLFKTNNQTNNNMKAIVNTMNPSCPCIMQCSASQTIVMLLCKDEVIVLSDPSALYTIGEIVELSAFSKLEYFTGTITLSN